MTGTWQRNLAFSSNGGPGIATNFRPFVSATLPTVEFRGYEFNDTDTIWTDRDDGAFVVWKDLDGFVDPCDIEQGRLDIAPGMDAFLAYLRDDPRFTVVREEDVRAGRPPAVEIEFRVGDDIAAPCSDGGVLLFIPQAQADQRANGPPRSAAEAPRRHRDRWRDHRVRVDRRRGWPDQGRPRHAGQIRFLDELPTPPAS